MGASDSIARYPVHLVVLSVAAELGAVSENTIYSSILNLFQMNHIHEPPTLRTSQWLEMLIISAGYYVINNLNHLAVRIFCLRSLLMGNPCRDRTVATRA